MEDLLNQTVASVVAENIKAAHVFKKYGIDFCCGGGVSIETACKKKNVSLDNVLQELNNLGEHQMPSQNYNNWALDYLVDHIVNTHHAYVKESIGMMQAYGEKVAKVHGGHHPPLFKIKDLQNEVLDELAAHLQKEEKILFPFIKKMVQSKNENLPFISPPFGTVENPINMMEIEHEAVGDLFKEIAELTNNYTPPDWACNTFKAWYAKLDEFEQDLHLHIHLENNILFPKALIIEKELRN